MIGIIFNNSIKNIRNLDDFLLLRVNNDRFKNDSETNSINCGIFKPIRNEHTLKI